MPAASGTYPAIVSVHGGAWTSGDRAMNAPVDQELAANGIVVLSIDFRLAPRHPYPASVADTQLAIRWLKANASSLKSKQEWIGGLGASSGGHQLLLAALRPDEPAFRIEQKGLHDVDARLNFLIGCFPISDPHARYRMAVERQIEKLVANHHAFFGDEKTMIDANPQRILDSSEPLELPPLLLLQGDKDDNVTPDMAQRFSASYRRRGGDVHLEIFEGQPHAFITRDATTESSRRAINLIIDFIKSLTIGRGGSGTVSNRFAFARTAVTLSENVRELGTLDKSPQNH
jgi:acetyl esterase/lipase